MYHFFYPFLLNDLFFFLNKKRKMYSSPKTPMNSSKTPQKKTLFVSGNPYQSNKSPNKNLKKSDSKTSIRMKSNSERNDLKKKKREFFFIFTWKKIKSILLLKRTLLSSKRLFFKALRIFFFLKRIENKKKK
jgi:hypothetical protein